MNREIIAFGDYYDDFMSEINDDVKKKVHYILDMLSTQDRVNKKFVSHIEDGIYEIRIEQNSNIYRIFFIFEEDRIVVLFHGFQKKTQKTPKKEIEKAIRIRKEYYEYKQNQKRK